MSLLTELWRIPTSGARGVTPFTIGDQEFLAIPQLAMDAEGTPPGMNGGDSVTDLLVLLREADGYTEYQRIPAPGGEDAEVFSIGGEVFLAAASIRTGCGPYEYAINSVIHRWDGEKFLPFQEIPTYAAKQWKHFAIGDRDFLALAQGVAVRPEENRASVIFEWNGTEFVPFQVIDSQWSYNWHHFVAGDEHYLAHADHVVRSVLFRWNGDRFVEHQTLARSGGRAFATFHADGRLYLAVAVIDNDSLLYRWDNGVFTLHQVLDGPGGREWAVFGRHLIRVNFITGPRENPVTRLASQIYEWNGEELTVAETFPTSGGTAVSVYGVEPLVAISNSLTEDVRFRTDTVIYRWTP
ncbi:hypothetical protein ACIA8G_12990 [Lentzea sp. NPDC051213]|uniref:hypothetical protein n=1 Tax=Lentzea sp. NPDC051213 TaxID=3364126 RepID=UPI0037B2CEE1